ncbi:MAG: coat protein [Clostridia bacterium]|nr:coat protein [Clostridia bacterium]
MAITQLGDIIVPELFDPYVVNRTKELSALFDSGIVTNNSEFDRLASEAATIHNMPFYEDLTGESEPIIEGAALTAKQIASNKDVSTTIRRANMWAATDLAAALSGYDPMMAVADLVAGFWARDLQKELVACLKGVFGTYQADGGSVTPMADHIADITKSGSAEAKKISAAAFIDALQLLGDAQGSLTSVVMDSATKAYLKKQNLIETQRDSTSVEFSTYQDRRVIVDDGCPVDGDVHTAYIFGEGAVAYGVGDPVGNVSTEIVRDGKMASGVDYLVSRRTFILHPRGVKWTDKVREHIETPTRAELALPENWQPIYEPKQIRVVAFKYHIG